MNITEFEFNNTRFTIDKYQNYTEIFFYTKNNSSTVNIFTWNRYNRIIPNIRSEFLIKTDSIFIELLINSEMFDYEQIDDTYYIFQFNNNTKLQLL